MSPASKSKSKDKLAARTAKEQQKPPLTFASTPASSGNGIPGSAYNPVSGTFHTLEMSPSSTLPMSQSNGRFRTIDETEDHSGSSLGTTAELDSLSNNGSCSGESEDPKEKPTPIVALRTEPIPGSDTDKREKIRQKNEKKHQRQKERRAQELHERCTGYLMSRKLEGLAQKLVSMGFSTERATMALIFNEGRVEESVMWLLEGGEEIKQEQGSTNLDGANLKIDIADEVAKIAVLEIKFKCTQTEVERAVVACEGDLDKAEDSLKAAQKQEVAASSGAPPKPDHHSSDHEFGGKLVPSPSAGRVKVAAAPILALQQQQRRDERDLNYNTKVAAAANVQNEPPNRNLLQPSRKILSKATATDWGRPQVTPPLDKRWPNVTTSGPSVSYPLASPVTPQPKPEAAKTTSSLQQPVMTLKEPIIMMQRPQSNGAKQQGMSASPPTSNGWYPNAAGIEAMKIAANGGLVQLRNLSSASSHQFYPQSHYQPSFGSSPNGPSWSSGLRPASARSSSSSSLAVPSSLGLFTSWGSSGSSGSSSPVDWSTGGSMPQCDYTSIDWSLDLGSLMLPPSLKSDQLYGSWSNSFMGSRGASVPPALMQEAADPSPPSSIGSREWTSPFNGKDLFTAPRQFVTSPSLEGMM